MGKQSTAYDNRKETLKRKTKELSILCNVKACAIILSPNGKIDTWPENPTDLNPILDSFKNRGTKNVKTSYKIDVKKDKFHGRCAKRNKFAVDDQWLDALLSKESKESLLVNLDSKLSAVKKRIEFLKKVNNGVGDSSSRETQEEEEKEVVFVDQETQNSFWESVKVDGQEVAFVKTEVQQSSFGELMNIACNQGQQVNYGEVMNNIACNQDQEFDFDELINFGSIQDQEAAFCELMNSGYNQDQEFISFGELMNCGYNQGQEFGFFGHEGQQLMFDDYSFPQSY